MHYEIMAANVWVGPVIYMLIKGAMHILLCIFQL